jgi:hypothetical protein
MATARRKRRVAPSALDLELNELACAMRAELHERVEHALSMWMTRTHCMCRLMHSKPSEMFPASFSVQTVSLPLDQIAAACLHKDAVVEL